jgi:hypothetical protein
MQCDPQQPALRTAVHTEIKNGCRDHAIDHALHATGVLLEDEHVARAEERERGGQLEPGDDRPDRERRFEDLWNRACASTRSATRSVMAAAMPAATVAVLSYIRGVFIGCLQWVEAVAMVANANTSLPRRAALSRNPLR